MTRTYRSIRNIRYTFFGQLTTLIVSFISRTVFVKYLGAEYLGLNGLFTNVLTIISLAELGIGSAIVFSMYKSLALGEEKRLKALMNIFKKTYITIGIWIFAIGLLITPFLGVFTKEIPDIPDIKIIFIMFVTNSALSYFFSYKRELICADQKKYVDSLYRFTSLFMLNIGQIFALVLTQNYILYLALGIVATFTENFLISRKADRMYPFLNKYEGEKLDSEDKKTIISNIKAMFFHKIGGVIVLGTSNLVLSKFVGILYVGIYSNYLIITNALHMVFGIMFQSVAASIGNLGATEDKVRIKTVFDSIDLIAFWIYGFASVALINLFNPFIMIWLGKEYIFEMPIVLLIVLNFYIQGQRKSVLTFRDSLGLFWYDRYKPLLESTINIIASIYFAIKFGVAGVLIGMIISTLSTCTWIEPYILYKYGLYSSLREYFIKYLQRVFLITITGLLTWFLCSLVTSNSLMGFIIRLVISILTPNIVLILVYFRTVEFTFLLQRVKMSIPI